ncbi:hypothetical protein KM043_013585 [Ampulex compressa]|nr:hypothetical protein KM043_013585 [Ampulex compressa]
MSQTFYGSDPIALPSAFLQANELGKFGSARATGDDNLLFAVGPPARSIHGARVRPCASIRTEKRARLAGRAGTDEREKEGQRMGKNAKKEKRESACRCFIAGGFVVLTERVGVRPLAGAGWSERIAVTYNFESLPRSEGLGTKFRYPLRFQPVVLRVTSKFLRRLPEDSTHWALLMITMMPPNSIFRSIRLRSTKEATKCNLPTEATKMSIAYRLIEGTFEDDRNVSKWVPEWHSCRSAEKAEKAGGRAGQKERRGRWQERESNRSGERVDGSEGGGLLTRSQVRLERLEFPFFSGHRSLNAN